MDDTALTILRVADLTGVLGCALLGGLVARQRGFDPIGFAVLAVVSGVGGGIVRDVLLGQGPPVALTDTAYVAVALTGAVIAYLVPLGGRIWSRGFPIVDAVALGCWAAAGTQKTLALGHSWQTAVVLGTVTAVGGGVIRDLLIRQVPTVFGGNTLSVTPAILAASTMVAFHAAGLTTIGLLACTAVGATLSLLAHHRHWTLPGALTPSWWGRPLRPRRRRATPEPQSTS